MNICIYIKLKKYILDLTKILLQHFTMHEYETLIHAQKKIKTHENVKNHFVKNHLEYKPLVLKIAN